MADGCFPGLPPLEVIGGAVDDALGPRELRAAPVHRSKRSFATRWGLSSSRRCIETAHVVGVSPQLWDAYVAVIRLVEAPHPPHWDVCMGRHSSPKKVCAITVWG
jgi:hypothetical protein